MPTDMGRAGGRRGRRRGRWLLVIGTAGLALVGAAYWFTYEPAPRIRVLWQPDITPQQQAALEQRYLLLNGRDRLAEGSIAYDLLDTSRANIRALVEDPAVADTNDIERNTFVVPFDVDYGGEWMWIAHRTPGLRDARLRAGLIIALVILAAAGLGAGGWPGPLPWRRPTDGGHLKHGNPSGPNVPVG